MTRLRAPRITAMNKLSPPSHASFPRRRESTQSGTCLRLLWIAFEAHSDGVASAWIPGLHCVPPGMTRLFRCPHPHPSFPRRRESTRPGSRMRPAWAMPLGRGSRVYARDDETFSLPTLPSVIPAQAGIHPVRNPFEAVGCGEVRTASTTVKPSYSPSSLVQHQPIQPK